MRPNPLEVAARLREVADELDALPQQVRGWINGAFHYGPFLDTGRLRKEADYIERAVADAREVLDAADGPRRDDKLVEGIE